MNRVSGPAQAWQIDESEFPSTGGAAAQLGFAVRYAVLAPSPHNAQPWRFRIAGESLELWADRSRALHVSDPQGRVLTISCATALFHLRVALTHFGLNAEIEPTPEPAEADLLARVRLAGAREATPDEERIFAAVVERRTQREGFEPRSIPETLRAQLSRAAAAEGAGFWFVEGTERAELEQLVHQGIIEQHADPRFRAERRLWMRRSWSRSEDGIAMRALGHGELATLFGPRIADALRSRRALAELSRTRLAAAPALSLIATDKDEVRAWMQAGLALGRILLVARSEGVLASYHNQPIELPHLRRELESALPAGAVPQLVLSFGYASAGPPTPRRSAESVTERA